MTLANLSFTLGGDHSYVSLCLFIGTFFSSHTGYITPALNTHSRRTRREAALFARSARPKSSGRRMGSVDRSMTVARALQSEVAVRHHQLFGLGGRCSNEILYDGIAFTVRRDGVSGPAHDIFQRSCRCCLLKLITLDPFCSNQRHTHNKAVQVPKYVGAL